MRIPKKTKCWSLRKLLFLKVSTQGKTSRIQMAHKRLRKFKKTVDIPVTNTDKAEQELVNVDVNPSGETQEDTENKSQEEREFKAKLLTDIENSGWGDIIPFFLFTRGLRYQKLK